MRLTSCVFQEVGTGFDHLIVRACYQFEAGIWIIYKFRSMLILFTSKSSLWIHRVVSRKKLRAYAKFNFYVWRTINCSTLSVEIKAILKRLIDRGAWHHHIFTKKYLELVIWGQFSLRKMKVYFSSWDRPSKD